MQLIGEAIRHQVYGKGIVTDWDQGMVTVCFSGLEKKFIYPDAFSGFLVLRDQKKQSAILQAIETRKQVRQAQQQVIAAAEEKRSFLRHLKFSSCSQAVFNIQPQEISDVFSTWQVSTGTYCSGYSKGEPRIPDKMTPNSLCLLTSRPKDGSESQRRIIGAFMVCDDFMGRECSSGVIAAHPNYRLRLTKEQQPLFWPYVTTDPKKQRWGSAALKYLSNTAMEEILFDLRGKADPLEHTAQAESLNSLYDYYCRINRLQPRHN